MKLLDTNRFLLTDAFSKEFWFLFVILCAISAGFLKIRKHQSPWTFLVCLVNKPLFRRSTVQYMHLTWWLLRVILYQNYAMALFSLITRHRSIVPSTFQGLVSAAKEGKLKIAALKNGNPMAQLLAHEGIAPHVVPVSPLGNICNSTVYDRMCDGEHIVAFGLPTSFDCLWRGYPPDNFRTPYLTHESDAWLQVARVGLAYPKGSGHRDLFDIFISRLFFLVEIDLLEQISFARYYRWHGVPPGAEGDHIPRRHIMLILVAFTEFHKTKYNHSHSGALCTHIHTMVLYAPTFVLELLLNREGSLVIVGDRYDVCHIEPTSTQIRKPENISIALSLVFEI